MQNDTGCLQQWDLGIFCPKFLLVVLKKKRKKYMRDLDIKKQVTEKDKTYLYNF